jgi:hypothetical protein
MKKAIGLLTVLFICATSYAQQQTLVVPPCMNRGSKLTTDELAMITDLVINAIQRQDRFAVPDREALALMTSEHKFQMSDWSDDTKSLQISKAINANYLAVCRT